MKIVCRLEDNFAFGNRLGETVDPVERLSGIRSSGIRDRYFCENGSQHSTVGQLVILRGASKNLVEKGQAS